MSSLLFWIICWFTCCVYVWTEVFYSGDDRKCGETTFCCNDVGYEGKTKRWTICHCTKAFSYTTLPRLVWHNISSYLTTLQSLQVTWSWNISRHSTHSISWRGTCGDKNRDMPKPSRSRTPMEPIISTQIKLIKSNLTLIKNA